MSSVTKPIQEDIEQPDSSVPNVGGDEIVDVDQEKRSLNSKLYNGLYARTQSFSQYLGRNPTPTRVVAALHHYLAQKHALR